jgi:hypothetical protein
METLPAPIVSRNSRSKKNRNSHKEEKPTNSITKRVDALRSSLSELPETDRNEILLELVGTRIK